MHTPPTSLPRHPAAALLLSLCLGYLTIPAPAGAQDADPGRFARWAYADAGALVTDLGAAGPLLALGGGVLLATPSTALDPRLLSSVQRHHRGVWALYLDRTNALGSPAMTPVVAGVFAITLATDDHRLQDAAFTSMQSLVYAGALTGLLKAVFGRYRPEEGEGAYRFAPFSGNTSFPSGHTTAAFALVTPWILYYPHTATYGLWALSAGTAVARIALDKHWPTDVVAGAAVGLFTARYLTSRHQGSEPMPSPVNVYPYLTHGGAGIGLRVRL